MNSITVSQAFSNAPPRSAAVLCVKGDGGSTDLLLTDWFTWLNMKRNPMILPVISDGSSEKKDEIIMHSSTRNSCFEYGLR